MRKHQLKFLYVMILMHSSVVEAQVLDSIRNQYFYKLPFKRSATVEDVITNLNNRQDSFVLLQMNQSECYFTAHYGTLFKDSFLKSQVRIEIWANCRQDSTLPCYLYCIRLVPGTITPQAGDSTKMEFTFETGLTKKERMKIFRSFNRSVYLKRAKLQRRWGREMTRYKLKELDMGTIKFANVHDGTNLMYLVNYK